MFPAINEELEPGNLSSQVFAQKDEANLLFLIEMKDSNNIYCNHSVSLICVSARQKLSRMR